ncbi:MAG: hypothetical protein ACP5XB_13165, partial [Isosphaeraceae bacterium]
CNRVESREIPVVLGEKCPYQAILREDRQEGRVAGEQRMLLRQGMKRFGLPNAHTIAAIEAIQDIDR